MRAARLRGAARPEAVFWVDAADLRAARGLGVTAAGEAAAMAASPDETLDEVEAFAASVAT